MDLENLKPKSDVITTKIKHPSTGEVILNDDGSEMYITTLSPHSSEYRNKLFKMSREKLSDRSEEDKDLDFDKLYDASIDLLAEVTCDWSITYKGEAPKLTKKKAKEVYSDLFWLKMQVDASVQDFDAFT